MPPWIYSIGNKLNELIDLPVGWDGYKGKPVSSETAYAVADLLNMICLPNTPEPSFVPGSDGSVQFEWHVNGIDIEVDVIALDNIAAGLHELDSGLIELATTIDDISEWIPRLEK